jgi:hypothetical protein
MPFGDENHRAAYIATIRQELAARGQAHIWPQGSMEHLPFWQLVKLFRDPGMYRIQPPDPEEESG